MCTRESTNHPHIGNCMSSCRYAAAKRRKRMLISPSLLTPKMDAKLSPCPGLHTQRPKIIGQGMTLAFSSFWSRCYWYVIFGILFIFIYIYIYIYICNVNAVHTGGDVSVRNCVSVDVSIGHNMALLPSPFGYSWRRRDLGNCILVY